MANSFFVVEKNHAQYIHADSDDRKRIRLTNGDPLHHSSSEDVSTDSPELAANEPEDITSGTWLASAGTSHVLVQSGDEVVVPAPEEPKPVIPKKLRAEDVSPLARRRRAPSAKAKTSSKKK